MELNIATPGGAATAGTVQVSDITFGKEFNESLVHQAVTAYLAGARQGTRAQKTRAAVSGGGRKPWKQKGGGRARAGSIRSPIWRGGGIAFAAQPQDHSQKINKKMYRAALRSILSELARQDRLVVVEDIKLEQPKTKLLAKQLADYSLDNALIIADEVESNLYLAARNIPNIDVRDAAGIDPVSLIAFDKVLITVAALRKLEEVLG